MNARKFLTHLDSTKQYCIENEMFPSKSNIICQNFKTVFTDFTKEILSKRANILSTLTQPSKRGRRGVINGVGNLANILFGICDDNCMETNSNNVLQLQQSEKSALNILKSQTRVIKAVVRQSEQSFRDVTFLRNKINEFMGDIRSVSDKLINKTIELEHKTRIQDSYLLLNILLGQYAFETNYISEMINLARAGQIHSGVLPIESLHESMKEIKLSLPKGTSLPFEIDNIEPYNLYKLSEVSVVYQNQLLMFNIKIPLVDQQGFNLYNIIPMPIKIKNKQFAYVKNTYDYIAISPSNEYFTTFTPQQLNSCKHIHNYFICYAIQPVHSKNSNTNCEMALFTKQQEKTQICEYLYFELLGSIFHKLEFRNTWIYTTEKENVVLTCGVDEKMESIELVGTGLLTLSDQCKGYASQNILHPVTSVQNTQLIDIIPETKIIKEGKNFKQDDISSIPIFKNIKKIEKLHDLNSISSTLDDINKDIDYQLTKQTVREVHKNYNYVFYGIVILFIFLIVCSLINKLFRNTSTPPVPLRDYNPVHFDTIKVTEV
uniref:Envelope fusion protein n=1 Tax=Schizaphis graminum TaxID=13262 RepID=A0A2S2NTW6_SCHGA